MDANAMWPQVETALDEAREILRRLQVLACESYEHPRRMLWWPLNAAATSARGVVGQLEAASHLLETWDGHEEVPDVRA
jgi:hypothetical protein